MMRRTPGSSQSGRLAPALAVLLTSAAVSLAEVPSRYFPAGLLHAQWLKFPVEGYRTAVTGVVYRGKPRPTCGMPLGGLDTGCLDIEPNGMLGYGTLFNHLVDPRLLYNVPFLGLSVDGETCVLATDGDAKDYRPTHNETSNFPPLDYTPTVFDVGLSGVNFARSIDYFGHYPVVDMEFDTDLPVSIGMRGWSPMLPGDTPTSLMPGMVFEFSLRNTTDAIHRGTLAVSFPGFEAPHSAEGVAHTRQSVSEGLAGVEVSSAAKGSPEEMSYLLAVVGGGAVRVGGSLGLDGTVWSAIHQKLPATNERDSGATLAIDFELQPGQRIVRRVLLTWHAPQWSASGDPGAKDARVFTHMYAKHYPNARATARCLAENHELLLRRIIRWQEVIYGDQQIPGWLADCLINNLHLITETSIWGQGNGTLAAFGPELGLFGLNECPRGCAQIECIPCRFYGNMPVVYFYPEAALSTLRGYKQYQFPDGRPPWIFGGVTAGEVQNKQPYDLASPDKGYQTVLNAACYIIMLDRYWQTTGDDGVLEEFYDSLKRANDFSMNLRPKYGLSQVMSMPEPGTDGHGLGDTEWFEAPEPGWKGYVTHAGAVRMAQVQVMKRMAEARGDSQYIEKCDQWLEAGAEVLEEKLWNSAYYLNFYDPDGDIKSDLIFGYQLDGEWICDAHGVPGVFPKQRAVSTLETIRQANCALSQSGATNYANPDGSPAKVGGYGTYGYFPPELMMLAMTFMYEGERDFGMELLRDCMENIVCQWGYTWDAPNTVRGDMDTGQRHFGGDYYQNMMLWFVPAAMANENMVGPVRSGGLVDRIRQAARGAETE